MTDYSDFIGAEDDTPLGRPINVTRFPDFAAKTKTVERLSLRDLAHIAQTTSAASKEKLPWIKLAAFGDRRTDNGSLRSNFNMESISGVEGDYDDGGVDLDEAAARLEAYGVTALLYTSPSHTDEKPRWRVLAPCSEDLHPSERRLLIDRLNGALDGILTRESATDSQSYYIGHVSGRTLNVRFVEGRYIDEAEDIEAIPVGGGAGRAADVDDDEAELLAYMAKAKAEDSFREDYDSGRLQSALAFLAKSPVLGRSWPEDWSTVVRGLSHAAPTEEGRQLWMEYAANSPRMRHWVEERGERGRREVMWTAKRDWRSYCRAEERGSNRGRMTISSLFALAREGGWETESRKKVFDEIDDWQETEPPHDLLDSPEKAERVTETGQLDFEAFIGDDEAPERTAADDIEFLDALAVAEDKPAGELATAVGDPGRNPNPNWQSELVVNDDGDIKVTADTVETLIRNDPRLYGRLGYNELMGAAVLGAEPARLKKKSRDGKPIRQLTGPLWALNEPRHKLNGRRWEKAHYHSVRICFEASRTRGGYGIRINDRDLEAAVSEVALLRSFHPIRDRLRSLMWDGVPRAESMFIDYLGCPDDQYHRDASRLMLLGAVARAFQAGHKFDFVPILEGAQGAGKSTFIRILGMDWSGELAVDFKDTNKLIEALQGKWIIEIPELQGFSKAETNSLKAAITRECDSGRLAFEKGVKDYPRQCIFIGSTNDDDYLRDPTGARRFWPIHCNTEKIDTDKLRRNIEQIWAEAVVLHDEMRRQQPFGDLPLYMSDPRSAEAAKEHQATRHTETPEEVLAAEIRAALDAPESANLEGEYFERGVTCLKEVWIDLLGNDKRDLQSHITLRQLGKAMRMAGWEPVRSNYDHPKYGTQKRFVRKQ